MVIPSNHTRTLRLDGARQAQETHMPTGVRSPVYCPLTSRSIPDSEVLFMNEPPRRSYRFIPVIVETVDALVIGSGVIGLTTAIELAEAGLDTTIRSAGTGAGTTSFAAGALWGPVRCGPPERTTGWSATGLEVMTKLADEPGTGIRLVSGREVSRSPERPPDWISLLPGPVTSADLPDGYVSGWHYTAPLATMPVYLDYLADRFRAAGGITEIAPVTSLTELAAPLIVNCTGMGARELAHDPELIPVRGQVVIVANPGIDEFYIDHNDDSEDYVYLFPHGDQVLLGGTGEEGADDPRPRPDVAERILRDCALVFPQLRDAQVLEHRVGLRPVRPQVRLQSRELPGGRVLWHNYGHGGGGVTLAWGCAREISASVA
jgi:D-amino-acid oxidase